MPRTNKSTPTLQQIARFLPTYRLKSKKPFSVDQVQAILKEYVPGELENHSFSAVDSATLAKRMSAELKDRIKEQLYDRYRIVVIVSIGEHKMQSYDSIMQFIWDAERDNYCTYAWDNMRTFAVVVVLGVYKD